jgi:alpha-galactosidase
MSPQTLPVMGFSTWYAFRTAISEMLVMAQANLLVSSGLAAAGYNFVNLDDAWMAPTRDASGALQADPVKFPSGIPALAAALHAMGLKLGIYTAIGTRTCQNMPGSYGHYALDVQTFARWGVDLVKVDACGGYPSWQTQATITEDYRIFGQCMADIMPDAIYSQELPVYALVSGVNGDFSQAVNDSATFANMWRVCYDESPLTAANAYPVVLNHLAQTLHLHGLAGTASPSPQKGGRWNDLDMVVPGYPASGWTQQDVQNQLAIWAMESSPLIISADLSTLPAAAIAALSNAHMVAINQSGQQCARSVTVGNVQALIKPDPWGGLAVAFVNMGSGAASATFTLAQLGITTATGISTDLWTGNISGPFSAVAMTLAPNTVSFAQLEQVPPA